MSYDTNSLPAGHSLTKDSKGRPQVICDCCGKREWIDSGKEINHLGWCDNKPKKVNAARRSLGPVAREQLFADLASEGFASPDHGLNRDFT